MGLSTGQYSPIKSVQYVDVIFTGVGLTATATLTSVNTAKTVISHLGNNLAGGIYVYPTLTNSTTVTVNVSNSAATGTVRLSVTEYV